MLSIAHSWTRLLSMRGVRSASFKTLVVQTPRNLLHRGYARNSTDGLTERSLRKLSMQHCLVAKFSSLQVWRAGDWRRHHGLLHSSLAGTENQRTTEGGGKRCWKQWMLVSTTRSKISCLHYAVRGFLKISGQFLCIIMGTIELNFCQPKRSFCDLS